MATNKRLNATITIGGAVAGSLQSAFGTVKGQLGQVGAEIRRLTTQQRTLSQAIQTFGREGKNVDGLRLKYAALTQQIDRLKAAHASLNRVQLAQQANSQHRADLRGQMLDAVAIGATAATPIIQAAAFEKAMLGVAKQVNGARDASGKLTQVYYDMGKQIQLLGRDIPIATNDIADMVTAGARMGIATDELLGFVKTSAMMASAFELPAGELADNMGKIAGIFKIPIPAIGELADSINYLDDNAISKGSDIIKVMQGDLAGAASTIGLSAKNAAALASTFLTLGESAERADTAASGMLRELQNARMNPKRYQQGLKMIGISAEKMAKQMVVDPQGTILNVLERIRKLPKDKQMEAVTRLFGKDWGGAIAKLAGGVEEYRRQLELANGAAAKGSMAREFAATLATTNAQWQLMKNRVVEVSVNIGSVLLPAVNAFFGVIGPVVSKIAEFARENPKLTQAVVGTAVALTSFRLATLGSAYAFTFLKGGALQILGIVARVRAGFVLASSAMPLVVTGIRAIGMAFVSTGIGALVAGLALGGLMIYRHWDGVKAFFTGVFDGILSGLQPVVQTFSDFWKALAPLHPMFEKIGGALQALWKWFTDLLQPVKYSQDELGKAGAAGKSFGEFLAMGINIALTPLQLLIEGLTWVANNIGGIADKAIAFKNSVGDGIGNAWQNTKNFIGLGDQSVTPPTPVSRAQGLGLPAPMMANRAGAGSYTDSSTNNFQIVQQPGENNRDLARRVTEEQERQRKIRQRGIMTDGMVAQ